MCLFHFLKISILNVIILFAVVLSGISLTCVHIRTSLCTTLRTALSVHFSTCSLECSIQFGHSAIDSCHILSLVSIFQFLKSCFDRSFLICRQLITQFLQLSFSLED